MRRSALVAPAASSSSYQPAAGGRSMLPATVAMLVVVAVHLVHLTAAVDLDAPRNLCGSHVSDMLDVYCDRYPTVRFRRRITHECCRSPCTLRYLATHYCSTIKEEHKQHFEKHHTPDSPSNVHSTTESTATSWTPSPAGKHTVNKAGKIFQNRSTSTAANGKTSSKSLKPSSAASQASISRNKRCKCPCSCKRRRRLRRRKQGKPLKNSSSTVGTDHFSNNPPVHYAARRHQLHY